MKISLKQYAMALYELTEGKSEKELNNILDNFSREIIDFGLSSKIDLILEEFNNIWNKKNNELEVKVVLARGLKKEEKDFIIKIIKKKTKVNKIIINNIIDPSILGGIKIEYEGRVFDLSFQEKLKQLKIALNKE